MLRLQIFEHRATLDQVVPRPFPNRVNAVNEIGGQVCMKALHPSSRPSHATSWLWAINAKTQLSGSLSCGPSVGVLHGHGIDFTFSLANSTCCFDLAHCVAEFSIDQPVASGHWPTVSKKRGIFNHHNFAISAANGDGEVTFRCPAKERSHGLNISRGGARHFQNSRLESSRATRPGFVVVTVGFGVVAATEVDPADGETTG